MLKSVSAKSHAAVLIVCLLVCVTSVQAQQSGNWSAAGSLRTGRDFHTATALADGKVLVVGGYGSTNTCCPVADRYDPVTGQWSVTGNVIKPRGWHTSTKLPDGKVLVTGGWSGAGYNTEISSEIYDPATDTWRASGSLLFKRAGHRATLLADGRVLVTGGSPGGYWGGGPDTAELYDPVTEVWRPAGTMNSPRDLHTSTLLLDGRVLVAGGINGVPSRSAELYDPATGRWTITGDLITPRVIHTATLLPNGNVLVTGGGRPDYPFNHSDGEDKAELYDPATGRWTATGTMTSARAGHTATLLPDGRVLVSGGFNFPQTAGSAELYDPITERWSATANMIAGREFHTATLLRNGKVLVAGGSSSSGYPIAAELYDAGVGVSALTLNSTSYCVGDPWNLGVSSWPNAPIQLSGTSNGQPWEVPDWGRTNISGNFSQTGAFLSGTEGAHNLRVDVGGSVSNAVSFRVSPCQIQLRLNSSEYCTGAVWALTIDSEFPNGEMNLFGTSNGEPWELTHWVTTGDDGKRSVSGVFAEGNEGVHSLRLRTAATQSNLFSFRVSRCGP